jgi:hypothetical protein
MQIWQILKKGGGVASEQQPRGSRGVASAAVEEPTKDIVPLRAIKYASDAGVTCCGMMQRHSLPKGLAEAAIKAGLAVTVTDPRVKDRVGVFGMLTPLADACTWIGPSTAAAEPKPSGVVHGMFEPMDRGAPIIGTMPVSRRADLPTVASQTLPPEE